MSYQSELYQQVILDHNRKPRNFREMADATHSCKGFNPLCGDKLNLFMKLDGGGKIEDISFEGSGCAISKASASMMTEFLKGKSGEELRVIFDEFHRMVMGEFEPKGTDHHLGKLKIFQGVRDYPARTKCATLPWHTLICALDKKQETTIE